MQKTSIEWVRNPDGTPGYTFNPITGCLNGCGYCYARKLAETRLRNVYTNEAGILPPGHAEDITNQINPFYPRFWPEKLKPLPDWRNWSFVAGPGRNGILRAYMRRPRGIFTCNMSDMFGPWVPDEWIEDVLDAIKGDERDRFYLLTKFPENLAKWSPFPRNCWVGVTATDHETIKNAVYYLCNLDCSVRYLSVEPLLKDSKYPGLPSEWKRLDWVIIGAQTKPLVLPLKAWVNHLVSMANMHGVAVFLKDSLRPLYPEGLRQEVPE